MITSKKTKVLDLKEGDLVYANKEFGFVTIKDRTLFHNHHFVKIKWIREDRSTYGIKYFFEDNKFVEKITEESETQVG